MRFILFFLIGLGACTPSPKSEISKPQNQTEGKEVDITTPKKVDTQPENSESKMTSTSEPQAESPVWYFTTQVEYGPSQMLGARGHYELTLNRDTPQTTITIRKVGQNGQKYRSEQILESKLVRSTIHKEEEFSEYWSGTETLTTTIMLSGKSLHQKIEFQFWFVGDDLYGVWQIESKQEIVGGLRGSNSSEDLSTSISPVQLPCPLCCDVHLRCGGMGPGDCNSSLLCY